MKKRKRMVKTLREIWKEWEWHRGNRKKEGSIGVQWAVWRVHSLWSKLCVPLRISALTQAANTATADTKLTSQLHYIAGGVHRPATPKGLPGQPGKLIAFKWSGNLFYWVSGVGLLSAGLKGSLCSLVLPPLKGKLTLDEVIDQWGLYTPSGFLWALPI